MPYRKQPARRGERSASHVCLMVTAGGGNHVPETHQGCFQPQITHSRCTHSPARARDLHPHPHSRRLLAPLRVSFTKRCGDGAPLSAARDSSTTRPSLLILPPRSVSAAAARSLSSVSSPCILAINSLMQMACITAHLSQIIVDSWVISSVWYGARPTPAPHPRPIPTPHRQLRGYQLCVVRCIVPPSHPCPLLRSTPVPPTSHLCPPLRPTPVPPFTN